MPIPATAGIEPFSAEDAWVYPFSAGAPGTGKDAPGFISISGDPQTTETEHRGDNKVLSKGATIDSIDLEVVFGYWDFDAITALVGGTVTTSGTTPNQVRKLVHKTTDQPADCAIKAQTRSKSADGGGTRVTYPRCQPQGLPGYGMQDQEYNDLTVNMTAIPNAANELVIVEQYETYTDLTSTF